MIRVEWFRKTETSHEHQHSWIRAFGMTLPRRPLPSLVNALRTANRTITVLILAVALGTGCQRSAEAPASATETPVFIISIDTLRSDRLPAYGYSKGFTPAIDLFRKDAVLFRSAFSNAPLTLPSHASLMTGRLPYRHAVRDNIGYALASEEQTLASILKTNGYATGAAVSSFVLRKDTGIDQGFESYDDLMTESPMESISSWTRNGDVTRQILTSWIEGSANRKLFGFLHLYEPHLPYTPPAPYAAEFADPYDGEIAYTDAIVGRFLDELRAKGLYDRALIILMSDHGEGFGDHGELGHGVFVYRESIQIPLMVKLPNGTRAGQEITTVASITDLMPTILAQLRIEAPKGLDGVDLFSTAAASERWIYSEAYYQRLHYGWKELISLTGSKHHYIDAPRVEVYDYKTDPGEMTNIAEDQRRLVAARRSEVAAVTAAHPFESPRAANPEDVAKLTALGYLGSGPTDSASALPDPKDKVEALTLMGRGMAFLQHGEYEKAVEAGQALVKDNPDFLHGWGLISGAYRKMGKRELALEALQEQMKRSASPQVALTMASAFAELGRYDEARKHAELALEYAPSFARETLATIAIAEGKLDVAENEARKSLEIEPNRVQALVLLSQIRNRQQRFAEELQLLDQTRGIVETYRMPKIRELELKRGEALLRERRVAEAEAAFRAETENFPDNLWAWSNLALAVGGQGRSAEAKVILGRAQEKNPGPRMAGLARQSLRIIEEGERGGGSGQ